MKNKIYNLVAWVLLEMGYVALWLLVKMGVNFDEESPDSQKGSNCQEIHTRS